ncbi:Transcriptional activator domain-containing protein [Planctomycetales bacterium 10988]|nr:Transcriptional activator domain-containing protein [Planctomycetales bacterium 10988]
MTSNPRVFELLEALLNSEKTPEDVCRDCPELLPEVLRRWQEFQFVDKQLLTILPEIGTLPTTKTTESQARLSLPSNFGRYQVRSRLGSGGFGHVYLGYDARLGRLVAIKVLHNQVQAVQPERNHTLQEAKRLAQLRHPGIVAVHDVGVHQEQIYLVSDFIEGIDLSRWLQCHRPTWQEAVSIASTVADALSHAHARRIIHRDVKPANILLTNEIAPVLVDFGLALDDTQAGWNEKGIIAGTPWYMSPEQAAGEAHRIDGRTDIYSLGAVLYQMLTGHPPFRAGGIHELLRQVREDEPQPPRQLASNLPPELERVCLKALAKTQQDRYTTALDFAADLRRVLPTTIQVSWSEPQQKEFARQPSFTIQRHTVGRQKEREDLSRAYESATAGNGLFVCVTGEPGIGKTTLVEDFIGDLTINGRPFLLARGRCSERLAGTEAYLPFLEALENLLHGEQRETVTHVMRAAAPCWYAQLTPSTSQDSPLESYLSEAKVVSQERLKRELGKFLQNLSSSWPLLFFIDDLHWADASTVDLLAYLGGRCTGTRVLFVFTYRPTDLAASKHPFVSIKLDLQSRGVCRELSLEFLPRSELERYLALKFPEHDFPEEFAAFLHRQTEGSPLFMTDLLRYLRDRKVIAEENGRWRLREAVPNLRRDLPESVQGMVKRKIDQLSEQDRWLLVAASVQGYEFDSAVVARILEYDAAVVEDRLEELDHIHDFVRMMRERELPDRSLSVRYHFVHVLYQNVLYESLGPTRRARLSTAVAEALLSFYAEKSEEVASDLASLFETARDFERAADHFLIAARNAAQMFANQEAVVLAQRGIAMLASLPDTPKRARKELALQIVLGPALFATKDWTAFDVERAYIRAQELCHGLGESPELFPALWGLFLFHIARGEISAGLKQGTQLLDLAQQAQDSALLLQAHHALGPTYSLTGNWSAAKRHLEHAIACYDRREHSTHAFRFGGHDPCVCCLSYGAKSLWMLGYPDQALKRSQEALALAQELGHPTSLAHTQLSAAILYQFLRDVSATFKMTEELQVLAADQGLKFYLAGGSVLKGWALVEMGQFVEGIDLIRQGFEIGGATLAHWHAYSLTLLAEAYSKKEEEVMTGFTSLEEALSVVKKTGIGLYEPEMHRLKGEFLLRLTPTNSAEAEACFHRALTSSRCQEARSLELRATMSLSRLWYQQGRHSDGIATLSGIINQFSEGFETPDLLAAATQLKNLS